MHQLKSVLLILGVCLFGPVAFPAGVAFPTLQFLVGNWEAESKPGEATAHFEFALDLQGKVLTRHNHVQYASVNGQPGAVHEDLVIVYQEGIPSKNKAIYFDSDGYGARYAIDSKGAGEVVLTSDPIAKVPRYRLTYTALPDGRLNAKLEVAPAGKPNAFANYLEWVSKKVSSSPTDASAASSPKP